MRNIFIIFVFLILSISEVRAQQSIAPCVTTSTGVCGVVTPTNPMPMTVIGTSGATSGYVYTSNGPGVAATFQPGGGSGSVNVNAYSFLGNNTGSTAVGTSVQYPVWGAPGFTAASGTVLGQITGSVNNYMQFAIQNTNSGSSASTDFITTANDGNDSTHYADFGINGSNGGTTPFVNAHAAYVYSSDNELDLAAIGSSSPVVNIAIGSSATNYITVQTPGAANSSVVLDGSDALTLPIGTSGTRPSTGVNGMIRYNSSTPAIEGYINNAWSSLSTASAGVSSFTGDGVIINNSASTGAVTDTLVNAAANSVLGNNTGSGTAPSYQTSINISGTMASAADTVKATSATAFAVGQNGATNPGFNVNTNTATSVNGISINSTATGVAPIITNLGSDTTGTGLGIAITAKTATATGAGGPLTIAAGAGLTTGIGGLVSVTGGAGAGSTAGGAASLTGGASGSSGVGGAVTVKGGVGTGGTNAGGAATLQAGAGGSGPGGLTTVQGGGGGGTQSGGGVNVTGGTAGNSGNQAGGTVTVAGGTANAAGTPGSVAINGGTAATGPGGSVTVSGTSAGSTASSNGGSITFTTGAGGSTSGNSGSIFMNIGTVTSGTVGQVLIGTNTPVASAALTVAGTINQSTEKSCSTGLTSDANGSINGCVASDQSLKEIHGVLVFDKTLIDKLRPVIYTWRDADKYDSQKHGGFIAQEVQSVDPFAIKSAGNGLIGIDNSALDADIVLDLQAIHRELAAERGSFPFHKCFFGILVCAD